MSGLTIDVFLLAVLLALHVTKTNRNTEMMILILLLVHVVMTTNEINKTNETNETNEPLENYDNIERDNLNQNQIDAGKPIQPVKPLVGSNLKHPPLGYVKPDLQVSSSEFQRQFSTPSDISKTSNEKIANARTHFFSDLFPHQN